MKILTVIGTRPQYIKAASLSRVLREKHTEVLMDTGQHYDHGLSAVFLDELEIPRPDYNLAIGSCSAGAQIAAMLEGAEKIIMEERPELVLVYGDTNSTLAGALAASKLNIPIAHVEAGPREWDMTIPEEVNRVLTDRLSSLLFCPTRSAVDNLEREGITAGVHFTGDVMYDGLVVFSKIASKRSRILSDLGLRSEQYLVLTLHHCDDAKSIGSVIEAVCCAKETIVFPMHPRMEKNLRNWGRYDELAGAEHLIVTEPLGYLDFLELQRNARRILTDSGGIQKEAYWLRVPCIVVFPVSPWQSIIDLGWNTVVGYDTNRILDEAARDDTPDVWEPLFGDGTACQKIADHIGSLHARMP